MHGCQFVDSHKSTGSGPVRSPVCSPSKKTKNTKQTTKANEQKQQTNNCHLETLVFETVPRLASRGTGANDLSSVHALKDHWFKEFLPGPRRCTEPNYIERQVRCIRQSLNKQRGMYIKFIPAMVLPVYSCPSGRHKPQSFIETKTLRFCNLDTTNFKK